MTQGKAQADLPKRFYTDVTLAPSDTGYAILLDGRPVKTPGRRPLAVPMRRAAEIVAAEWDAQRERIDPATMPMTRLVNTVIEAIADDPNPVRDDLARYIETDLLFYRAGSPHRLVVRQREMWDPVLDWARETFGGRYLLTEGVMHVGQPPAGIAAFRERLASIDDPFRVAALHQVTTLTGSALLALAVAERHLSAADAWMRAHVDEDWNIDQWGADDEASARREMRWQEMQVASVLLTDDEPADARP
ncbi:ATP12 family protein [Aurantimonas sp. A2-1-M11]|uniref:ATP12 family chaperone protein n=1 Tax=Aurantimonas sp. A2-1-M11 TaxID=3113712 RepID=UPI002F9275F2